MNHTTVNYIPIFLTCVLCLLIAACSTPAAEQLPTEQPTVTPEAPTAVPDAGVDENQPTVTPMPTVPAIPQPTLAAELAATAAAELPPTPTPDETGTTFGGFEGVNVFPLDTSGIPALDQPFWVAHTLGIRTMTHDHFVGIYTRTADGWQEVNRITLSEADVLFEEGITQVEVAPGRAWLEIQAGVGAHSGTYALFSFDGTTLNQEAAGFNPIPVAGWLDDLNGDGIQEVVLNESDPYVFCYACGVIEHAYQVLRWNGSQMVETRLTYLPENAPADLRQINNRAIDLAEAGLWQDAELLLSELDALNVTAQNEAVTWNSLYIRLVAEARAEEARTGGYPLLGSLFYGDYTAVIGIMSGYSAAELFSLPNPLIVGTVAEGWEEPLTEYVITYTSQALALNPDLAPAHFLRGWAHFIDSPASAEALTNIQQAAALDPDQPLFAASVAHLSSGGQQVDDPQAIIAAATAYMRNRTGDTVEPVVIVEKIEGDYARVTITTEAGASGPLLAFLQRQDGMWRVIADGAGPVLDTEGFRQQGIPETLLEDLNGLPEIDDTQDIIDAATAYIRENSSLVADFQVEVWAIEGNYALAQAVASSSSIEPAIIWLARRHSQWEVLSMGANFDEDDQRAEGIPPRLINLRRDIRAAITDYVSANDTSIQIDTIEIARVDGDYARAIVYPTEPGAIPNVFLQRENDTWTVIAYGQGFVDEQLEGIPPTLLP